MEGVSTVAVSLASGQVTVGQSTTATAILRDAGGTALMGRGVAWSASPASVATVSPTGQVTAVGVGTASITAASEGKSGVATLIVSLPPVDRVEVSFPSAHIVEGRTAQATAILRDANQQSLGGRLITWSTSAPSIASVNSAGVVTALAAGSAMITATSEGKAAQFALVVDHPLSVTRTDSLLEPGKPFTLTGTGLSSATVLISGVASVTTTVTDASLTITVPAAPWLPCLGPSISFPLTIRTLAGDTLTLARAAGERPLALDLAPGAYADIPSTTLQNCRMKLTNAGTYLAMPFLAERPDATAIAASDSVNVSVRLDGLASLARLLPTRAAHASSSGALASLRSPSRETVIETAASRARSRIAGAQSCPLPPLGGTVTVNTLRDRNGQLITLMLDGGAPDENWTVVEVGQSIVVLIDTSTVRIAKADPRWGAAFKSLVALADTAIVPFLQANSRGIPDSDGNGKLIVYVTGARGRADDITFIYSMRSDCQSGSGPGEAILLDWTVPPSSPPYAPSFSPYSTTAAIASMADIGWREHVTSGEWAIDGFARVMANLFNARSSADPLNLELVRTPLDANSVGAFCLWHPRKAFADGSSAGTWTVVLGCDMMGYMFQQYRARFGGTLKDAVVAWSKVPNTTTMEDADSYFQQPRGATRSFPHWLLSWYADDYVAGVGPELTQSMWNMRKLWSNEVGGFLGAYPAPDIALGTNVPAATFKLGAPDVHYIEFDASNGTVVGVTRTGTLASDMGFLLLRAK